MAEAEEVMDSALVDVEAIAGHVAQAGDLGTEGEAAFLFRDEQRLDAHRVAGERQPLLELVPDGDGEHAFEPAPRAIAPAQPGGEDGLGVAMVGLEAVSSLELAAKVGMIDDLPVEDDRVAAVGAEDRLMPAFHIDDAEAAHAEAEIAINEIAGIVGSAMDQPVALARDDALLDRPAAPPVPACNSAHAWSYVGLRAGGASGRGMSQAGRATKSRTGRVEAWNAPRRCKC